jgi:hypothetical protein
MVTQLAREAQTKSVEEFPVNFIKVFSQCENSVRAIGGYHCTLHRRTTGRVHLQSAKLHAAPSILLAAQHRDRSPALPHRTAAFSICPASVQ